MSAEDAPSDVTAAVKDLTLNNGHATDASSVQPEGQHPELDEEDDEDDVDTPTTGRTFTDRRRSVMIHDVH